MKVINKFLLCFLSSKNRVEMPNNESITIHLDTKVLFIPNSENPDISQVDFREVVIGKQLTVTLPFGQLDGKVVDVREGLWHCRNGKWIDLRTKPSKINYDQRVCILIDGTWKGGKTAFFNGRDLTFYLTFEPTEGELVAEWDANYLGSEPIQVYHEFKESRRDGSILKTWTRERQ